MAWDLADGNPSRSSNFYDTPAETTWKYDLKTQLLWLAEHSLALCFWFVNNFDFWLYTPSQRIPTWHYYTLIMLPCQRESWGHSRKGKGVFKQQQGADSQQKWDSCSNQTVSETCKQSVWWAGAACVKDVMWDYAGGSEHPDILMCKWEWDSFSCKLQQLATAVVYLYSCEGFLGKEGCLEPDMIDSRCFTVRNKWAIW